MPQLRPRAARVAGQADCGRGTPVRLPELASLQIRDRLCRLPRPGTPSLSVSEPASAVRRRHEAAKTRRQPEDAPAEEGEWVRSARRASRACQKRAPRIGSIAAGPQARPLLGPKLRPAPRSDWQRDRGSSGNLPATGRSDAPSRGPEGRRQHPFRVQPHLTERQTGRVGRLSGTSL
jgi:hypothetical protein